MIKHGGRAGYDNPEVVAKAMKEAQANRAEYENRIKRQANQGSNNKDEAVLKTNLKPKSINRPKQIMTLSSSIHPVKYTPGDRNNFNRTLGGTCRTSVASAGFIPLAMLLGLASASN